MRGVACAVGVAPHVSVFSLSCLMAAADLVTPNVRSFVTKRLKLFVRNTVAYQISTSSGRDRLQLYY